MSKRIKKTANADTNATAAAIAMDEAGASNANVNVETEEPVIVEPTIPEIGSVPIDKEWSHVEQKRLWRGRNVRAKTEAGYAVDEMVGEIIKDGGITEALWVKIRDDLDEVTSENDLMIIKGQRRDRAVEKGCQSDNFKIRSFFERVAANMPVRFFHGSMAEAELAKLDHQSVKSLTEPIELTYSFNLAFDNGWTEKVVVRQLEPLINALHGRTRWQPEQRQLVDRLNKELRTSKSSTGKKRQLTPMELDKKRKELDNELLASRKGVVQNAKALWECPAIVLAAVETESYGEQPESFEDVAMPQLRSADIRKLRDIVSEEQGTNPEFNKMNPGPDFFDAWNELVNRKPGAKKKEPKTKTVNEMITEIKKYSSNAFRQVLDNCIKNRNESKDLTATDADIFRMEMVKRHSNADYKAFMSIGKAICQERQKIAIDKAKSGNGSGASAESVADAATE